jgi:hypothetical protein
MVMPHTKGGQPEQPDTKLGSADKTLQTRTTKHEFEQVNTKVVRSWSGVGPELVRSWSGVGLSWSGVGPEVVRCSSEFETLFLA